jgi:uncharacterized protein (TIGR00369 family)
LYREHIDMQTVRAADGESEQVLQVDGRAVNGRGVLQGGLLCGFLDSTIARAVNSVLPPGRRAVTASITVEFLRPVPEGATVVAVGHLLHAGRSLCVGRAEASVDGQLVGTASGTWKVLESRRAPAGDSPA